MATGVKPYVVTSLLVFIFFLAMASWQYSLAQDNNSPQNIFNDTTTSQVLGNGDFGQNYTDDSNVALKSYFNSSIATGGDSLLVEATPGITQTLYRMPKAVFTLMTSYLGTNLLSTQQIIVMTLILGVFTTLFVLYAIKMVKLGVPD